MERTQEKLSEINEMRRLHENEKWSLRKIGKQYGISGERVRQLLDPVYTVRQRLSTNYWKEYEKKAQKSRSRVGDRAEHKASRKLFELGISNKEMLPNDPFDIFILNGQRVDVKSRTKRNPNGSWSFPTAKNRKGDYTDFFILYIWETDDYFIVPNDIAPNTITFTWAPITRPSKWHQYHNRFDLLEV